MVAGRATRSLAAMLCGLALVGPAVELGAQPAGEPTLTVPVAPVRILDTRAGIGTGGLTVPLGPNSELELSVGGVEVVPVNAVGVVLNLTATEGTEPSFLTVYPSGTTRPNASVLNVAPGTNLPNMITAKLGDGGKLRIYNFAGTVHVLADVAGYLVPAGSQALAEPAWGRVSGFNVPSLVAQSANVAGVAREPGWPAGAWCITFAQPIPIARRVAATVSGTQPTGESVINITADTEDGCPGGLRVHSLQAGTNARVDSSFTFLVP